MTTDTLSALIAAMAKRLLRPSDCKTYDMLKAALEAWQASLAEPEARAAGDAAINAALSAWYPGEWPHDPVFNKRIDDKGTMFREVAIRDMRATLFAAAPILLADARREADAQIATQAATISDLTRQLMLRSGAVEAAAKRVRDHMAPAYRNNPMPQQYYVDIARAVLGDAETTNGKDAE